MSDPITPADTEPPARGFAGTTYPDLSTAVASGEDSALLDEIDHARRYRAGDPLGMGGMGEVRMYRDELIGRDVALKVIHGSHVRETNAVQRFLREARVQAQLDHPSIVPIHDVGRTADGRTYFTMKRVRGRTLADILADLGDGAPRARARYSRRKLLTAFVSVCQAIELAHDRGVLHRDLKPSNIMLGDFGEVYVLDWGVARLDRTAERELAAVAAPAAGVVATETGAVVGTPGYMSPEQARGDHAALDGRTDVYALGAILFELLALEPLHPLGTSAAALVSTLAGPDARPSRRAPAQDVPPELDAICVEATALDLGARTPGVRILSDAVERFLDGDRDLALRQRLAAEHAARATAMAAAALAADDDAAGRSRAMQEVGRALALDADHPAARRAMIDLLTALPRTVPAEARTAIDAAVLESQHFTGWTGVISYLTWIAAMPIGLWMGVVDRGLFAIFIAVHVMALLGCLWLARAPRIGGAPVAVATFGVWLATGSLGLAFGPLVLVPTVVASTMTMILLHPRMPSRAVVIVGFSALVLVPAALELLGTIAPSYRFDSGVMGVIPRMVRFTEAPALLALVFGSMATIVILAIAITRIRTRLSDAEQRLQLHAWQLRQLVP